MVLQYKCPDCGADMSYDAEKRVLLCPSCGHAKDISEMENEINDGNREKTHDAQASSNDINEIYGDYEEFDEKSTYTTYAENDAVHYICENCGAELITDKDTTATSCSYCGAPMILGDRLSGKMAPAKVIPFSISKQQAEQAFRKWCKNGLVTPKDFMTANRIKSITGMYVPFWLYDVNGRGEVQAKATRTHSYTSGDYRITETKHYNVYRKVSLNFDDIPVDASEKMPDDMMDKLEPFSYNDLVDFNTPYLSGFIAEKYNYTDKELFPRLKEKTFDYVESFIQSTITSYDSVNVVNRHYDAKQKNASYTLLPVWMLAYDYHGKEYLFAMNGQTGKVVGKPPISKGRVVFWYILFTIIFFVAAHLIGMACGGEL